MLVVMPNGHPNQQAAPPWRRQTRGALCPPQEVPEMHTRLSAQGMMDDVIAFQSKAITG